MKSCNRFNRTTVSISIILGIIIVFWGFQVFGGGWTEEQEVILNLEKEYWECLKNADFERYKELWHDNALPWPNGSIYPATKADTVAGMKKYISYSVITSYDLKVHSIRMIDDVAVVCYSYSFNGSKSSDNGRITHTWLNDKGGWKIIGGMNASHQRLPKND
jgi:hypothetical protein